MERPRNDFIALRIFEDITEKMPITCSPFPKGEWAG